MTEQASQSSAPADLASRIIFGIFGIVLGISAALAISMYLMPFAGLPAASNYLQIATAFAGAIVFVYAYFRYGRPDSLLYAAGAFGLWGIANSAWYVNILLGRRNDVFPGLIDIGIVASIFLLTVVYQHAFPRKQIGGKLLLGILLFTILVPGVIIITCGATSQTFMTFLYFFVCGSLILTGLIHSLGEYPLILAGTLLFCAAFMIYPIRETFFAANPYLNVIGPFVSAGLALIVMGLVPAVSRQKTT